MGIRNPPRSGTRPRAASAPCLSARRVRDPSLNATQMICQSGVTKHAPAPGSDQLDRILDTFLLYGMTTTSIIVARAVADAATARAIEVTNRECSAIGHRPDSTKRLSFGRPISIVNFFY